MFLARFNRESLEEVQTSETILDTLQNDQFVT